MEQVRVYQLARELGLSSQQARAELGRRGEKLPSVASIVSPTMVTVMRRVFASRQSRYPRPSAPLVDRRNQRQQVAATANDDFESAVAAVKRGDLSANGPTSDTKRKTGVWKGQPPSAITQALLDVVVVPRRSRRSKLPADKYYVDEMDRAQSLHSKWAAAQLDCPNLDENAVVGWIHLTGGTDTYVVKKLAHAGITPEDAKLRLAYNRMDPTADTIYYRLLNGYMSVKDAANQVKRWKETTPERAAM